MSSNDIAVIGMAGRFPGAANIAQFWANIRGGLESIRPLSDEELAAAGVPPEQLADPAYVKACPVLEGVDQFDPRFFGLSPRDASVMDPAHRLFLEVAWEALEHAGQSAAPEDGPVGVFAGSGASYYLMDNVRPNAALMRSLGEFLARHTNNDMNFLATRVSYELDLRGPSINVQTACSSALVAVHMACESIRRGECRMALAGGSTVLIPDRHGYVYHEGEILSPDGHCRPFDAESAGTVFGSGSGCVVLKSLEAALGDGDTVHAVIKGSAVNNDGALRVGFLAPGVDGQSEVVSRALDAAGVPAETIGYIETHGTGTRVGDPIEVAALNQAYRPRTDRRRFCGIGSVKSNIGHLGEAAGVASLIKAILALKHGELPPSLGYQSPNPQIDFDDSPFFVNDRLRPWPATDRRRCGVTALGAGGTNCHMILEEAPAQLESQGARPAQLLVLSARTEAALGRARERLAEALEADATQSLGDVAWTLATGRRPMAHRSAVVARTTAEAVAALRGAAPGAATPPVADDGARSVVFMFPGGGAQYAGMGADLFASEPAYREAATACLEVTRPVLGDRVEELLLGRAGPGSDASRELERPTLALPALFTTEYALARLLESWGLAPAALLGHSMGEYVAACLSGVMTVDEALRLVMLRGRLFETVPRGAMLSVRLGEQELTRLMPPGLSIAAINAPELCVASGPVDLIDALERTLGGQDIDTTRIHIDVAAHSAMLDPVLDEFRRFCRTIDFKPPTIPFLSNVTGQWISAQEAMDPDYWVRHLRSTVRFADCLATLAPGDERALVEVGPGRTLTTLARFQERPAKVVHNAMRHPDEAIGDVEAVLGVVGRLWQAGVPVDWPALYDGQLLNRVPLPTYPWDHARYWLEPPVRQATAAGGEPAPAGERRARVDDWFERPVWRQTLPTPPLATGPGRVLVFADDAGVAAAIGARLAEAGRSVVLVRPGEAWSQEADAFTIRAGVPDDHLRLLQALAGAQGLPEHVVHAWGITERPGPESLEQVLERGFHSLHGLAQALATEDPDARLTLSVLTSDLQRVGGEALVDPRKALVLGPGRVMPQEFPNVRSRSIDVALPPAGPGRDALVRLLAAEVASEPRGETIALRGLDRFEQVLERVPLEAVTTRLRREGVYLITGGLGGLGLALARHLAEHHHARLALIGRGATPAQARGRVAELEALGAQVDVIQADVTDAAQVRDAVARVRARFGALHGIFHAAGVLGDSLMPLKTRQDAERVLAPKVQGTLALDAAVGDAPLDLFVLFSSISSIAGLPGQADYTAANAFLDAFAQARSARDGSFTVAVNWSAWSEVGMAANIAAGTGGGGAQAEIHPVLGRRLWSSAEAELFASDLAVSSHWVLAEHRIRGGRSLMPGTGHVELVRAAIAARPEPRTLEIRDLSFMSAFVVDDDRPRELRVHVARHGTSATVVIAGRTTGDDGQPVWQEHVTASAGYVDEAPPPALDLAAISARCGAREDVFTPEQESVNMQFGKRWKNLRSIRYGAGEALVALELPAAYAADLEAFGLHPALLDMATGRCEALVPQFNPATDFYVPLSYTRIRQYAPLPARLFSHVRLAPSDFDPGELLVFDVTITDASGRVLVDVSEFVMTRVTDTTQLQSLVATRGSARRVHANFDAPPASASVPALVRGLEDAIRPAEGMAALDRILGGPAIPQVFATPVAVHSLIADLRRPPTRDHRPAEAEEPTLPVGEIEAVLVTHETVQACAVMQRRNRPGELKLVAYVLFQPGEQATVSDLRRFLKARLAETMVPSSFVEVEELPRTPDGAIDRSALPDPFGAVDDSVAPRTETERVIAGIWKEVLGVERISVHDNFFDAGGHSLLAVRVVVKIEKKIGVRLNQAIMVLQTLEQIAAECDKRQASAAPAAAAAPPVTPAGSPAPGKAGGLRQRLFGTVGGE